MNLAWSPEVMGNYFSAAGIRILRGRDFTAADQAGSQLVAIVNRSLAERYWPGQDPIGKRLRWGLQESPTPWLTIVGVSSDIKQNGADAPIKQQIYQPDNQTILSYGSLAPAGSIVGNRGSIVLRSALQPDQMIAPLQSIVHSLDPQLALVHVESMDQVISEGEASRRFNAVLISSFAVAAVSLALLGIYSLIAFWAAMRTQEMAIRIAMGSQRSEIMRLVFVSGAKLGLAGCSIGVLVALFCTHLLRSLLFEVNPFDPLVIAVSTMFIFVLTLAASVLPARRAASVDPIRALRTD
jgi:ABC-type antimicrobial peptide transport system permease subunit